jgi:hypothetical protein
VTRIGLRVVLSTLVGLPLLVAVVLMASRVGDEARFVTWPVVAFTALAAVVGVLGLWTGVEQPSRLGTGLLLAVVISYFLPAAPFLLVAAALLIMGVVSVVTGGVPSGLAAGTAVLMVVIVVLQDPVVQCGTSSVSTTSGPWWIPEPSHSSGHGFGSADGDVASGTIQVGHRHYRYSCADGRLASFDTATDGARPASPAVDAPPSGHR